MFSAPNPFPSTSPVQRPVIPDARRSIWEYKLIRSLQVNRTAGLLTHFPYYRPFAALDAGVTTPPFLLGADHQFLWNSDLTESVLATVYFSISPAFYFPSPRVHLTTNIHTHSPAIIVLWWEVPAELPYSVIEYLVNFERLSDQDFEPFVQQLNQFCQDYHSPVHPYQTESPLSLDIPPPLISTPGTPFKTRPDTPHPSANPLAPHKQGARVKIWNVVTGKILRSFKMVDRIRTMVYSQKRNWLAIAIHSPSSTAGVIIDLQTGTPSTLYKVQGKLSSFTFSGTAEEIVCSMKNSSGLKVINLSTKSWRHIKHPQIIDLVSTLSNGAIVVDFKTGVQLLSLDDKYTSPKSTLAVDIKTFDKGRIIAVQPPSSQSIQLLELSTMCNIFTISSQDGDEITLSGLLTVSFKDRTVVYCFERQGTAYMRLCRFDDKPLGWNVVTKSLQSAGEISPASTRLVTFEATGNCINVWDVGNGQLQAECKTSEYSPTPFITFESETQFYTCDYHYSICHDLKLLPGAETTHQIVHGERQSESRSGPPWTMELSERQYKLGEKCQWVVRGSEKIFWIPPGYLRSGCWARSNMLVMIGEDTVLRAFYFAPGGTVCEQ
ncbi:hypothetical protein BJ322DRAFT_1108667 [Thelephora terrestris]|uniref:Uncharacterized protein n=1 Tax=Thelephora terrestris TaxID=56493 RepID=A0A9P6HES0_9AGAM|nr:hypothetical protein BJ322DRAFT_1108667 [Thelephora terrestris]